MRLVQGILHKRMPERSQKLRNFDAVFEGQQDAETEAWHSRKLWPRANGVFNLKRVYHWHHIPPGVN